MTRPLTALTQSDPQAYIDSLKEPFNLAERAVLFVVGFEFGIGDPYPHVAKQLRALGLTDEGDRNAKIEVQQMAWNFLRDRWGLAMRGGWVGWFYMRACVCVHACMRACVCMCVYVVAGVCARVCACCVRWV